MYNNEYKQENKTLLINKILPNRLKDVIKDCFYNKNDVEMEHLNEIRIRTDKLLIIKYSGEEYYVNKKGFLQLLDKELIKKYYQRECELVKCGKEDVCEVLEYACEYSVYAYEDEIRQGFITIKGGHRIGVVGKSVFEDNQLKTIDNISGLNIRVAHEVKGCSDGVMNYLYNNLFDRYYNTLIIAPPGAGKTTLLRDIIRNMSFSHNVGVVDERSEIAACYEGAMQNDLGVKCDVLDGCNKSEGMLILLRSMSPDIIAVDEIGTKKDIEAIKYLSNCGCSLIATIHGTSIEDVKNRNIGTIIKDNIFERYIIIKTLKGEVSVYDNNENIKGMIMC